MTETIPGISVKEYQPPLEKAAITYIDELEKQGLIKPVHALTVQLVKDLARAAGMSARDGKASGMAMATKELREAMALLPSGGSDAMAEIQQKMMEAAHRD